MFDLLFDIVITIVVIYCVCLALRLIWFPKPKKRKCKNCKVKTGSGLCLWAGTFNTDDGWKYYPENCDYYKRKRLHWWAAK